MWIDGGMGYDNLPLVKAYIEVLRQGWLSGGNSVHILAIGSGHSDHSVSFDEATKESIVQETFGQIKAYIDAPDGGMARYMSTLEQVSNLVSIADVIPNLTFQWIDWTDMPAELDKLDNVRARKVYYEKGKEDGAKIVRDNFKLSTPVVLPALG